MIRFIPMKSCPKASALGFNRKKKYNIGEYRSANFTLPNSNLCFSRKSIKNNNSVTVTIDTKKEVGKLPISPQNSNSSSSFNAVILFKVRGVIICNNKQPKQKTTPL